jgi:HEXXH motif-containing protein
LPSIEQLMSALRAGPVTPAVVTLYSDIVVALRAKSQPLLLSALDDGARLSLQSASPALEILTITDADLGRGIAARYAAHANDDPLLPLTMLPLSQEAFATARSTSLRALALIRTADGSLFEEMRALVRQVILAIGGPDAPPFGGVTTFYVWGAIFINPSLYVDAVTMASGLVHEAAHALLLGSTMGDPLVENDPGDRYKSPLRPDPRPMDGIVHAAFVLARMHFFTARLARSSADVEPGGLKSRLAEHRREFESADDVITRHVRFTEIGRSLYLPARAYMQSAIA